MYDADFRRRLVDVLGHQYVIAHRALVYYARLTKELNATGYANLRDALSHLRRVLASDPKLSEQQCTEQLACAAEHIRRAAVEAYQECFELYHDSAWRRYRRYRERCLHQEAAWGYSEVFDHEQMLSDFARLREDLKKCRRGKDGTDLSELVKVLVPACEAMRVLSQQVDECYQEYQRRSGIDPMDLDV